MRVGRLPAWQLLPIRPQPVQRTARVSVASRDEVMRLLANAAIYQEAYLRSFLHMGFRLGELIYTRIGVDLDLDSWEWTIQTRPEWQPKNVRGHRTLMVPASPIELRLSITRYLQQRPATGQYVFRNPRTCRRWNIDILARDFYALCKRAGVPYGRKAGGLTLHTLRHTCATNMIRAGVLETIVAGVLGDTIQMVSSTYVHPTPDDLAAGIARSEAYEQGEA